MNAAQLSNVLLVLVCSAGCLWGCGGSSPGGTDKAETSSAGTTGEGVEDTAPPAVFDVLGERGEPADPCDGVDNNANGIVDEGWPDVDGDGVADCVDRACSVEARGDAEEAGEASACEADAGSPGGDVGAAELLWSASDPALGCRMAAGDVDGDGVAEVLCSADQLYVYDGVTGELQWESALFDKWSPIALADLDGDGFPDIAGIGQTGSITALDGAGGVMWESTEDMGSTFHMGQSGTQAIYPPLVPVDIDADGSVELVSHHGIVRGQDGALVVRFDVDEQAGYAPRDLLIADLDRDGIQEICDRFICRAPDGKVAWEIIPPERDYFGWPHAVQADTDDAGEVLWLADGWVILVDDDGTELDRYASWSEGDVSSAAIADIDGDGISEMCFGTYDSIEVTELDGTAIWSQPASARSGATVCLTADLDGDGDPDFLFADDDSWQAFDGASGDLLVEMTDWSSDPMWEKPIPIDLDGDGTAELVIGCGSTAPCDWYYDGPAVAVYANPDGAWAPTFPLWPYDTYSGVGMNPDGSIQRTADPSWTTHGIWRGYPAKPVYGLDLRAEVVDACVSSCSEPDGEVRVAVRLLNLGPFEADERTRMAAYALDAEGSRTLLDVISLEDIAGQAGAWYTGPPFLDNGLASPSYELVTTLSEAEHGLLFVAGDDGTGNLPIDECAMDDNTVTWSPDELCE